MATLKKYGTRSEVFDLGTALQTRGGLKKENLMISSRTGKIVSKRKSEIAKSNYTRFGFKKRQTDPIPEEEPPKKKRVRRMRKKKVVDE